MKDSIAMNAVPDWKELSAFVDGELADRRDIGVLQSIQPQQSGHRMRAGLRGSRLSSKTS